MVRLSILFFCWLLASTLWPLSVAAHGDDGGHDQPAAHTDARPSGGRIASSGSVFELVAVAGGDRLTIYVDRVETNEPVVGAAIEISLDGQPGLKAASTGQGTYEATAPWLSEPGPKPLVFTVMAGSEADLLNGVLNVADPSAMLEQDGASTPGGRLADPVTWLLIGAGLAAGLAAGAFLRSAPPATVIFCGVGLAAVAMPNGEIWAHEGHVHGDAAGKPEAPSRDTPRRHADGSAFVPKPTQRLLKVRTRTAQVESVRRTIEAIGTVIPDPSAFGRVQSPMDGSVELGDTGLPYVGQSVKAGDVLARLVPTIPLADLGTMQQLRAEVAGKLKVAEQKLARLTRISTVVAQSDIEDTRVEMEALREQRRVLDAKDAPTFDLKAPVSGVIATASVRAGQVVSARDTLFEIIDPDRLWVEAAGADTHGEDDLIGGVARDADGHTLSLSYIGRSPMLRQQSQSLLFRLTEQHTGLAAGASVTVIAQRADVEEGIVLPQDAVVRGENGLPIVWVKTAPEEFKPVLVVTRPLDGERAVIAGGFAAGTRVVTRGAELINQIR
jgi:RND family efflux transporter MFP subunit